MEQSSSQKSNAKSNSFENLSREELIKKCKGLLLIAQKAKQIKDDIQEENTNLKEQLQNYEIQKQADKKCLAAMQELVNSSAHERHDSEPIANQQEHQKPQIDLEKYEEILIENDSLKSQIKRLLAENEEYLKTIETFSPPPSAVDQLATAEGEIAALREEIKSLKSKNSKSEDNLKQFKSKLVEFSIKLKHFKSNHAILLEIINDYGKTVPKWQTEIARVSANICDKVLYYEKKNKELQNHIITLESLARQNSERQNQDVVHNELKAKVNSLEKLKETFSNKLNTISEVLAKIETLEEGRTIVTHSNRERSILKYFVNKLTELFEYNFENCDIFPDNFELSNEVETRLLNYFNDGCTSLVIKLGRLHECTATEDKLKSHIMEYENKLLNCEVLYNEIAVELMEVKQDNARLMADKLKSCEQCDQISCKLDELHKTISDNENVLDSINSINEIKEHISGKLEHIKSLNATINEMQISIKTIVSDLDISKAENQDLLQEMKEINQILKERGGVISKQQSKILDLENRIEILEKELDTKDKSLLAKQKDFEAIENLIKDKDIEIQKYKVMSESAQTLKDKLASDKMEILSTSTISKAEGQLQLREVDDSFEEKYNKLRVLAIKLKHKITEQNGVIANIETENKNLIEKLKPNLAGSGNGTKVIEENLRKITIDLENKEKQLKNSQELEKTLRAELEKSKLTAKKSNVLSLEIEAYEKSLHDLNQKQELNKIQIADQEETIRNLNSTIHSLNEQLKLVEENLKSEKQFSVDLKLKNDFQQTKIREIDSQKFEIAHKYENLLKDHEHLKLDMDQLRSELSDDIIAKDRKYGELMLEKENLLTQIVGLNNEFETLNSNYKLKDNEIENLKEEFANYKVRAQSVLRQNQSMEGSREKELEDDMMSMQTTIGTMTAQLKDITNENISLKKTIGDLKVDAEMFQNRCNELLARLDNTRIEYETNLEEIRKQNVKQQETIRTQRSQIDSINHCYKIQITEMEEKYTNEIKLLREKVNITLSSNQNTNLAPTFVDNNNESFTDILRLPPSNYNSITTDEQKIQMILQEKEMAEISNNDLNQTTNRLTRQKYETIPLDQLLNNPIEESTITDHIRSISPTRELNVAKETIGTQSSQIKHLSTLLAEAEQDLLRLTQLNELLKQEVRKQQLNLEREQHIQNSEYMKNVIFKFVTLNSGDEKLHLVPVLNTILKLNPEETNKLQAVAKGEGSKWLERFPLWSNNS